MHLGHLMNPILKSRRVDLILYIEIMGLGLFQVGRVI